MRHYLFLLLWVNVMAISAHSFQQNIELRDSLVQYAKTLLNTPYRSGSKGPNGFDCSGFTHYVFQRFGVPLGESSRDQVYDGREVATDQLKKGDLVFFKGSNSRRDRIGHVGIVIGHSPDGGFNFIHAAYDGGVRVDNSLEAYYAKRYITGCCVLAHDSLYHYHAVNIPTSYDSYDNTSEPLQMASVIDHRVKRGESLYLIAHKYHISEEKLKELNHLSSNDIQPGQKLILSEPETHHNIASNDQTPEQKTRSIETTHRVKRGESLYTIARKYHVNERKLKELNHLSSNDIQPGEKLIVKITEKHYKVASEKHDKTTNSDNQELASKEKIHVVKSGETLLSIARKYHVTTRNLKEWNHLSTNHVRKGKKLIIILAEKKSTANSSLTVTKPENNKQQQVAKTTVQATRTVTTRQTHRIRSGESLYTIARKYHTNVAALKRLNHLTSTNLKPGKIITVSVRKKEITSEVEEVSPTPSVHEIQPEPTTVSNENTPTQSIASQEETDNTTHSALKLKNAKEVVPKNVQLDTLYSSYLTTEKHIVQQGETFASIAYKYNVSEQDIKAWNGIPRRQSTIAPGKELLLQVTKKAFVVVSKPIHEKAPEKKQTVQSVKNQESTTDSDTNREHVVKKGESLYSIANQHHLTVEQLKAYNHLGSKEKLKENQVLQLTSNSVEIEKKDTTTTQEYIVKPGDTLSSVAKAYHVTVEDLKQFNQLLKDDLNIGQRLTVPVYPAK
jgi:LysM repeat protein